jgi:hypothetical protein
MKIKDVNVKDVMESMDGNKDGDINFQEFVKFIGKVKRGEKNELYEVFSERITTLLNSTPMATLEDKAKKLNFKVFYSYIERRKPTSLHPYESVVMQVLLEGECLRLEKDRSQTQNNTEDNSRNSTSRDT